MRDSVRGIWGLEQAISADAVRSVDLHIVLFVSCVLYIFHVDSQTPCVIGWFGPNCRYRCRCTSDSCDQDGVCVGSSTCVGGWFGPACQYADLAQDTRNLPVVIDGDDNTCVNSTEMGPLVIRLNRDIYFTWLRIRLGEAGLLSTLQVQYIIGMALIDCNNDSSVIMDEKTLDVFCYDNLFISGINIAGEGLKNICSVHISGGRNVALKEQATQNSVQSDTFSDIVINYTAEKAVDGRRNPRLHQGKGCAFTSKVSTVPGEWSVTFSQPRTVNRYLIFNRIIFRDRLRNFSMVSEDRSGNQLFTYQDKTAQPSLVYSIVHAPMTISRVVIRASPTSKGLCLCEVEVYGAFGDRLRKFSMVSEDESGNQLFTYRDKTATSSLVYSIVHAPMTISRVIIQAGPRSKGLCLCEVEVYGDSACGEGSYGWECEYDCDCPCNGYDFPLPVQCLQDTTTEITTYRQDCQKGSYHSACDLRCSDLCSRNNWSTTCGLKTGYCLQGCLDGYLGDTCTTECAAGYFGRECQSLCSQECLPGNTTSPCHHTNGHCLNGCLTGFAGPLCVSIPLPVVTEAPNYGLLSVVVIPVVLTLSIVFCLRKKNPESALEEKPGNVVVHT